VRDNLKNIIVEEIRQVVREELDAAKLTIKARDAKTYKYGSVTDDGTGTTATIWTPASGKAVRVSGAVVSATAACSVELRFGTTTFTRLEFNEKRAVPLYLPYDIKGSVDEPIVIYALTGSGVSEVTVYVTVIGEEE